MTNCPNKNKSADRLTISALGCRKGGLSEPLLNYLIHKHSGCNGDIERLYLAKDWDACPFVTQCQMLLRNTLVFGSHYEAYGTGVITFSIILIALLCGSYDADTAVLKEPYRLTYVILPADG